MTGYGNLHGDFGWALGVRRSPVGYQHPWLVVFRDFVIGCWTRREARECWAAQPECPDAWYENAWLYS